MVTAQQLDPGSQHLKFLPHSTLETVGRSQSKVLAPTITSTFQAAGLKKQLWNPVAYVYNQDLQVL